MDALSVAQDMLVKGKEALPGRRAGERRAALCVLR
jgi:hypothetical protein